MTTSRALPSETQGAEVNPSIEIRDLTTYDELHQVRVLEKEVWQLAEGDQLPLTLMIANQQAGNLWVGAFAGDELVGFAFCFLGHHGGKVMIHSHQLAVRPAYRDLQVAYRLKLAQRERALAMGIRQMTWTFDPLQSKNAHFNFAKVGVISDTYKENFYGPGTSSALHQNGTDRLWVTWHMTSPRVEQRLRGAAPDSEAIEAGSLVSLVHSDASGRPIRGNREAALSGSKVRIEVPPDINRIQSLDHAMASGWRSATRWALTEALKAGFVVAEFCRPTQTGKGSGAYLLEKGDPIRLLDRT
jgi:predicted GNAT superfamily acetyltransferase